MSRRAWISTVAAAALLIAGLSTAWLTRTSHSESPRPGAPTIVLILTDDQRWDTLQGMPNVQRELVQHGVDFTNAFVTDPLCCPSRASILTGQYAHTHGVWQNNLPYGGFRKFQSDRSTIATWLDGAGYQTGLFGKYLNQYEGTNYVPPGWDRWVAFDGSDDRENLYFRYRLNVDGRVVAFGDRPQDYSTDVLARHAVSFVRNSTGPLFVYFAPYAPHMPTIPAPEDTQAKAPQPISLPPSYDEADVSDKSAWLRRLPRFTPEVDARIAALRTDTYASLLSVDRAVGQLMQALRDTGRLGNALVVFMSDNGLSWGEHRLVNKTVPYEESIRVPMVVRYDRLIPQPRREDRFVLNLDLAPTFAAAAGVPAPGVEGRNFLPLLRGRDVPWRTDFLIEFLSLSHMPSYCGLRTEGYLYVDYQSGEQELYDLVSDPYELENRARDPAEREVLGRLRSRTQELCNPPPPRVSVRSGGEGQG